MCSETEILLQSHPVKQLRALHPLSVTLHGLPWMGCSYLLGKVGPEGNSPEKRVFCEPQRPLQQLGEG